MKITKVSFFSLSCFLFCFVFASAFAADESLTITTYYPSPYGSYKELQLYPNTTATTTKCDSLHPENVGVMYYRDSDSSVRICTKNGWKWIAEGAGATGLWVNSISQPRAIVNANTGNVGIGTDSPLGKLHVKGSAVIEGGAFITRSTNFNPTDEAGIRIERWWDDTNRVYKGSVAAFDYFKDKPFDLYLQPSHGKVRIGDGFFSVTGTPPSSYYAPDVRLDVGGHAVAKDIFLAAPINGDSPRWASDCRAAAPQSTALGQYHCYYITYTSDQNNPAMCRAGYYAAGIWDNGGGMPGPNGLVCCSPVN